MTTDGLLRVLPSRLDQVDAVCSEVRALCSRRGWSSLAFALELVLRECLNNAIVHGNGRDPRKRVELELVNRPRWVRVRIADEGPGFDWRAVRRRSLPAGEVPGGRGLPITATYARRVRFNAPGNQITVWFRHLPQSDSCDL